jgi:hypothetical protein
LRACCSSANPASRSRAVPFIKLLALQPPNILTQLIPKNKKHSKLSVSLHKCPHRARVAEQNESIQVRLVRRELRQHLPKESQPGQMSPIRRHSWVQKHH